MQVKLVLFQMLGVIRNASSKMHGGSAIFQGAGSIFFKNYLVLHTCLMICIGLVIWTVCIAFPQFFYRHASPAILGSHYLFCHIVSSLWACIHPPIIHAPPRNQHSPSCKCHARFANLNVQEGLLDAP